MADAHDEEKSVHHRYLNRETSLLAFNARVLEEAQNPNVPLLERIKFLSISAANLDEFYMIRVAGLMDQRTNDPERRGLDGRNAEEQLALVRERAGQLFDAHQQCWRALQAALAEEGYRVCRPDALTPHCLSVLESYFDACLFAALSPIIVDAAHPLPFLPNLGLTAVVGLESDGDIEALPFIHRYGRSAHAVIILPGKIDRFVDLPPIEGEKKRFVKVEDVIRLFIHKLFPNRRIAAFGVIHVTRDSDLEIEEDAEDLMRHFESAVKQRRRGRIIRLQSSDDLPEDALKFVLDALERHDATCVSGAMACLPHVAELCARISDEKLAFPRYKPRFPERVSDFGGDYFAAIQSKDMIVHHPYETFDVVVDFLRQAAADPDVVAIKQTLYRTSNDSPVVKALVEAAEAGKAVTVVVELKARFDEEANIKWARNLELAGAQVVFGFVNLKTHAKLSLAVRREEGAFKSYVHCGTGNYHPVTAKIYSDLSFFTCDDVLCRDVANIFNFLTGYADSNDFEKIFIAPVKLREAVMQLIDKEMAFAEEGKPATIWAKMNSLLDKRVIDKLYEASGKGVKIALIVRGVCALRPGVKGLSENITVKSIVGRFLEHSRIYCFGNGEPMPSPGAKVFISSADLMSRNLSRRVEALVPVENPTVHEQTLGQVMLANMRDNTQSWHMDAEGNYRRAAPKKGQKPFSAHLYFMENHSLSGRGASNDRNLSVVTTSDKKPLRYSLTEKEDA
ncbi:MAG: RNA degradosome polyphosphate kinase [Rickettsiales bacterium]